MNLRKTPSSALLAAVSVTLSLAASLAHAQSAADGVNVPNNVNLYALTSDNSIYVLPSISDDFFRLGRVTLPDGGNLIGIDFRPADATPTKVYGLTDQGNIFIIDVSVSNFGATTAVSTMNPRFTGGLLNVFDFNPVVNALRVTGSNDQNIAVTNGANGANLTTTVNQTRLAYATGDVNAGKDPEITGGAYNNNVAGATVTIFYMIDHNQDTLVTIATKNATGSSNTGGGQLQTIGNLVDTRGNRVNMSSTTDFDIFTNANGVNLLVGMSAGQLFSIDLAQVNPNLAVGQTQNIVVRQGPSPADFFGSVFSPNPFTGGVFDVAMTPRQ